VYVLPFRELTLDSLAQVGGKNASLGEMLGALAPQGVAVPDGFAVTAAGFHLHLAEAGLSGHL
jgi:pyruvate,water dikinase